MHVLNCGFGAWKAFATVEELTHHTFMAVIKIFDDQDSEKISSRHVVVFDKPQSGEAVSQTQSMMKELLVSRYGA